MLNGKTVLLGVSGGIAAYKAAALASALVKQHCNVHVLMTQNATQFISPLTFEALTNNRCSIDTFDRNFEYSTEHIALAKQADACIIAPATANVLAKLAHGLADDMLTTTVLACGCPKLAAPAMNTGMYENPITQRNLELLRSFGWTIAVPAVGRLACGDVGTGKMPEPEQLLEALMHEIACPKDLLGVHVLVTAGATQEAIDPVRYITNHSTGKMGCAIARAAAMRGAQVTLVAGRMAVPAPAYVEHIPITSAQEMYDAVLSRAADQQIIIKAAAVADYRPVEVATDKIKKQEGDASIQLARTLDILKALGETRQPGQFLCGFSMETRDMIKNSSKKLESKRVDMIAANSLREEGAGFGVDTNHLTLITRDGCVELPLLSKEQTAHRLLDEILKQR